MNILPEKCFKTVFEWLCLAWYFASITYGALRFFEHDISQGNVTTYLRCDRIFKYVFVANLSPSLSAEKN